MNKNFSCKIVEEQEISEIDAKEIVKKFLEENDEISTEIKIQMEEFLNKNE